MVLMLQDKYDNHHHHHHHHHHHNLNHTTVKICIKFPISGTQKQFSLSPHMPLDILHKRVPHTQFVGHNGIILLLLLNQEVRKVPIWCL